jgi:hypothetical protein
MLAPGLRVGELREHESEPAGRQDEPHHPRKKGNQPPGEGKNVRGIQDADAAHVQHLRAARRGAREARAGPPGNAKHQPQDGAIEQRRERGIPEMRREVAQRSLLPVLGDRFLQALRGLPCDVLRGFAGLLVDVDLRDQERVLAPEQDARAVRSFLRGDGGKARCGQRLIDAFVDGRHALLRRIARDRAAQDDDRPVRELHRQALARRLLRRSFPARGTREGHGADERQSQDVSHHAATPFMWGCILYTGGVPQATRGMGSAEASNDFLAGESCS